MKKKLIIAILIMAGIIAANVFAQDEVFQIRSEMTNSSEKIVNEPLTIDGIIKWEETFDTIIQPTDWQVIDNDGSGAAWDFRQLVAFTSGDTVNPHAGQSYWFSNFNNANPSGLIDEWLISPKLPMIESGDSLHFYAGAIGGSYDDSLRVWISTTDSLPGSFTDLIAYFKVDGPTGSWYMYSFDLDAYAGSEIFVAVNYYIVDGGPAGTHSDNIWVDHFILEGQGQAPADKLLISEFVVTPTEGEFVEIFNPNPGPVVLSDYYLTDATFAGGNTYYYQIVEGGGGGGGFADWHARFPDGATIQAGEYQTIALNGDADFFGEYGVNPTYEMDQAEHASGVPDTIPDMREAVLYSIFGSDSLNNPGLTNGDEVIILYHWDGMSDLVGDLDYVLYNAASPIANNEAVDKTGVRIDGPDPGTDSTEYLPDTAILSQISAINHTDGFSVHRTDFTEGVQVTTGGNGVTGANETSEDLDNTFTGNSTPSPNGPNFEPPVFFDDFESGTTNWTLEGGWGLTDQVSYSPTNSLTESPVGNYPPNQDISATMANGVDLSAALDATLSFWARYNIEQGFDYMYVEVSTNGGAWVQIAVFDGEGFDIFQEYSYSLGGFVGNADVKVRFRFFSDGGYEVDGMYIDDFMITSTDVDNTPPLIVHAGPEFYEGTLEDFMVETEIVDISGLASANALYTVDGGSFNSLSPDSSSGDMYYFTIPMQAAGVNVDYWITATDNASNVDTVGIFKYIAGNHLIYDNAVVDFVYQYFATQMVAVQMSVPAGSQADLASALIRNYTDINRPNDTMLVHIWADAGGLPGADLITPFLLYPEATLTNTSPMTRMDLRSYSAQLSGLTGDFFVGFSVPAGVTNGVWLVGTSPSAFNRTYVDVGTGWVAAGQDHHFRAIIGDTSAVGIAGAGDLIPEEFALYQNYPNPFNPTTTIKYALKENADVSIKIYNLLGQEVRTLVNARQELGYKTVVWNGLNNSYARVASGVYIYRIQAGDFVQARKMILMK